MDLKILLRKACFFMLFSLFGLAAFSQKTVTGLVKDKSGEPMIGVNVTVKGEKGKGNVTDINGIFSIPNVMNSATLHVSYIGYISKDIPVGNKSNFSIYMEEDTKDLDEVVVVGYGVVKKSDLTGAVSSVKDADLERVATSNAVQALQAKVPGLDVQQSSGEAGSSYSITLRATRSITASNSPLILVDGIDYGSTLDINPSDIESMEILKDASSTAIYGTRGANGVIIITTKHGKAGKTKVNFNSYWSYNSPTDVPEVMYGDEEVQRLVDKKNYQDIYAYYQESKKNTGTAVWDDALAINVPADVLAGYNLADGTTCQSIWENKSYTDWLDMILQNSWTKNYELAVSGGNENTTFNMSLGAMYDEGLMENDALTRYNLKANIDHKINSIFKSGVSALFTYKDHDKRNSGVFSQGMKMTTITHAYLNDGSINATPNPWYTAHCSPLLDDVPGNYKNNVESTRFFGNAYVEATPIKGLSLKSLFAADITGSRQGRYMDYESQSRYQSPATTYMSQEWKKGRKWTWDNTVNYNTDFNQSAHNLTVLLGHEMWEYVNEQIFTYGDAGQEHYYGSSWNDLSKLNTSTTTNGFTKASMLSFFGRVNYKFNEKYLLTATMRADGSSSLAEGNKWGYFPSVAAAWRLNQEEFMEGMDWLDNLKIRASWGLSGNAAIDPYQTLATLSSDNVYYYFTKTTTTGNIPNSIANENLTWEKTSSWDFGFDFGVFNNRISGSVDYYNNHTSDLLFYKSAPASSIYQSVLDNIGETKGSGIEISLNTIPVMTKDFSWSINWSYTHSTDEITKLSEGVDSYIDGVKAKIVGERVNAFYDYEDDGCWNVGEFDTYLQELKDKYGVETTSYPAGYGTPGTMKIVDRNHDGKLSSNEGEDDRRVYNRDPKHIFGMNNTFAYKDFSLQVQVYARIGGYISYDFNNKLNYETANWGNLDYWTPTNTGAKFPSPGATDNSAIYSTYNTSLKYEKADYLKIKDITLSYNLPAKWLSNVYLSKVRVYGSLKNYITFSKIDNYDPERGGSISFPLQKQFVFGLNVEF